MGTITSASTADGEDFADFFAAHYPRLLTALQVAGAPAWQAEEVAQEAFARAFSHWRRIRSGTNPAGYVSVSAFRLWGRQRRRDDRPIATGPLGEPGPEDHVALAVSVDAVLAAMPARQRACAAMCLYLGMSAEEAARALGITAATVRTQLHRARTSLRAALEESSFD